MKNENSLIESAVEFILKEKKPYDLYELFDVLTTGKKLSEDKKTALITKFYSDLTTSAKFVYTGDNHWDLKGNQKIELWEKDGSFYKEYTKVELPDEYKEKTAPKAITKAAAAKLAKAAKAAATKAAKAEAKAAGKPTVKTSKTSKVAKAEVEPVVEPAIEVVEPVIEVVTDPVVGAVVDASVDAAVAVAVEGGATEIYEEVFEEADEFDEEKYNEYMDTYEDQYDKTKR